MQSARKVPAAPAPAWKRSLDYERSINRALREVARAISERAPLDALLQLVQDKSREVMRAEHAALYLLQGDELRSIDGRLQVALGHGPPGRAAKSGKPVIVSGREKHRRFLHYLDKTLGLSVRTSLCVPMIDPRGRLRGTIQVSNRARGGFTQADAALLLVFASQAAASIDYVQMLDTLRTQNEQLSAAKARLDRRLDSLGHMAALERAMAHAESVDALCRAALDVALTGGRAERVALLLQDPDNPELVLYVRQRGQRLQRHVVSQPGGLLGFAMQADELAQSADGARDERARAPLPMLNEAAFAVCVALDADDSVRTGAFGVYGSQLDADSAVNWASLVAANISTSLRLRWSRDGREREERLLTIGRLLSGVMHDLKTPLAVLNGYVQLMQVADARAQRDEYAALMNQQLESVFAMQRDVLEFARGERNLWLRKVYLAQFFERVQSDLQRGMARSGVELILDVRDRGTARFDESKMLRVVHNLGRNAAEAMQAQGGGTFRIVAERHGDRLVWTLSDTGPGIPQEIRGRLFRSFVTSGKKGGTGLGLAIVKRIIDEHGGSVRVSSGEGGIGTSFRIELPQGGDA